VAGLGEGQGSTLGLGRVQDEDAALSTLWIITSVPNDQRLRPLMLPAIAISALLWVVIGTLIAMGMHWIW
jgi:hypothetical protein